EVGIVTDSQGIDRVIRFSRPELLDVWISVTVHRDPLRFPANGADQIRAAIVAYADANFRVGSDVIASALAAQVFSVPGVVDVPLPLLGVTDPPTSSSNIVTTLRQLARLDTS